MVIEAFAKIGGYRTSYSLEEKGRVKRSEDSDLLTTGMAARILNVHQNTILRWTNLGMLPCYRIGPRRDRRIRRNDVMRLLEEQAL